MKTRTFGEIGADEMIDNLVILAVDELPPPGPEWEGRIFYLKPEKTWYGCDGSTWIAIGKGKK